MHTAANRGQDVIVALLIERGANIHLKNNCGGFAPLDFAKRNNHFSTAAAIIEAAMQSTKGEKNNYFITCLYSYKYFNMTSPSNPNTTIPFNSKLIKILPHLSVIYTSSQDLQQNTVTFKDFSNNVIIVSDNDIPNGFEFEEHPVITLQHIQQCLDQLPRTDNEDNISPNNIHDILVQIHPTIATRLQYWGLNVLHLIAYLPKELSNNMHEVVSSIVSKCPQATTSVDIDGMTPLHHAAINLPQKKTSQDCHDVLLARSSPIVVHKAIEAGMGWEYLYPIVMAKTDALTMEDAESGLIPFMIAAMKCNDNHVDGVLGSLSVVYELLCLKPDAMKEYDVSIMMKKRVLDGRTSTSAESSDQCTKRAKGA